MKSAGAVAVGVRELKNKLTAYLKLAKADREVIVTERGRPIAIIQGVESARGKSAESRIAALVARGEVVAPERPLRARVRRARVGGRPLSDTIVADRR